MQLSEAIQLGAMMKPQAYSQTLTRDGRTCAFGAAFDALGCLTEIMDTPFELLVSAQWPWIRTCVEHPAMPMTLRWPVFDIILSLNDRDKWTREQIASWVATIEPASEAAAEPLAAVLVEIGTQ